MKDDDMKKRATRGSVRTTLREQSVDFTLTRWNTAGESMPPRVCPVSCLVLKNEGRWGINTLIFNTSSRIYE